MLCPREYALKLRHAQLTEIEQIVKTINFASFERRIVATLIRNVLIMRETIAKMTAIAFGKDLEKTRSAHARRTLSI